MWYLYFSFVKQFPGKATCVTAVATWHYPLVPFSSEYLRWINIGFIEMQNINFCEVFSGRFYLGESRANTIYLKIMDGFRARVKHFTELKYSLLISVKEINQLISLPLEMMNGPVAFGSFLEKFKVPRDSLQHRYQPKRNSRTSQQPNMV